AVDANTERESAVALGVDATRDENSWVDHPAATPFDPAFRTAGAARIVGVTDRRTPAHETLQIGLGARLGERKIRGPKPSSDALTEHGRRQRGKGALEMSHRDALVDHQTLDLVEHRAVGGVEFVRAE